MSDRCAYIEVAVALPVDGTYTYSIPESLISQVEVGMRVLGPFGRRRVTGYVLGMLRESAQPDVKHILDVLDEHPLFPASMLTFFRWIAEYYKYPLGEVIKNALPGGLTLYDFASLTIAEQGQRALQAGDGTPLETAVLQLLAGGPCRIRDLARKLNQSVPSALVRSLKTCGKIVVTRELRGGRTRLKLERVAVLAASTLPAEGLSPAARHVLAQLADAGEMPVIQLVARAGVSPGVIETLKRRGLITLAHKPVYRDPFGEPITADRPLVPTVEQQAVLAELKRSLGSGFATYLLKGVTGSGKTEVYLQVVAEALKKGTSALVLVPEIALITQTERRFRSRFGDCVAILHSGLSAGERFDQWQRILQKEVSIAIGARSAVFAPFENLGVVVVDEEHDTSYKQEHNLRYNARDLAVMRAKLDGCLAVLGSATPSVQSCYNVTTGKFLPLQLEKRVEERSLPKVEIVDLREQRGFRGLRKWLSAELRQAMAQTLENREQVLLFLNRRGFATFAVCAACGQPMRCKHCDISLTLHQRDNAYRCHYCGFTRPAISSCDSCGSANIKKLGLGTERVEEAVRALFPEARVARMDRDTTTRRGSILALLKGLQDHSIDILIGTQMVAKGHDFPNITLVGIICADLSLSFPDFRAGERTFQLLAQVAGRAGRGDVPGRVILQTFNPEHFTIQAARAQDVEAFYRQEIQFRKALGYPPFARMIQLRIVGKDYEKTRQHALQLGEACRACQAVRPEEFSRIDILGPIEASLSRIAEQYRWQILLKGEETRVLHRFTRRLMADYPADFADRQVIVVVDVDPYFVM
jgi:primosomal protein N' (replication factor Y) (superfamily II helicase)